MVDKPPHEVWFGKKSSITHLIVLRCDAFMNVPKEKRRKMHSKENKCIFIGFKYGVKGYKMWNPITRKTHTLEVLSLTHK